MNLVLITGGSSGIGFQLSRIFAKHSYKIIWVSEDTSQLSTAENNFKKEFPSTELHTFQFDLTQNDAAEKVYHRAKQIGEVNILVNNAGFGTFGFLSGINEERELQMIQLNIVAMYRLSRLFLKDMVSRNEGRIMNLSSNTAFQPVPLMATYSATKSFIKQFSQSLNDELRYLNSKVTVTTVCPPATKNTAFQQTAKMENIKTFDGLLTATPEEVAKFAFEGTMKGRDLVLAGNKLQNLNWLNKVLPTAIIKYLLKKELSKK